MRSGCLLQVMCTRLVRQTLLMFLLLASRVFSPRRRIVLIAYKGMFEFVQFIVDGHCWTNDTVDRGGGEGEEAETSGPPLLDVSCDVLARVD